MIFRTFEILYYVEGVESFPLENIDEKKYFYTISLSMEITLTSILKGSVVDFICNINVDDNSPLSILIMHE